MTVQHEQSSTRDHLLRAYDKISRLQLAIGHTNLPRKSAPDETTARIDELDAPLQEASDDLQAARRACQQEGRATLEVVG